MPAIARFSRWAMLDSNIVLLARTTDDGAAKLLGIVAVDRAHFSPARPFGLHADAGEPVLLWQDCMCNCESGCEGTRLLQVDSKANYHATEHVDHHGQRQPLDGLPMLLIDHDDVHGGVVDLGNCQRVVSAREVTFERLIFFRCSFLALASFHLKAIRER